MASENGKTGLRTLSELESELSSQNDEIRWKAASELTEFALNDPEAVWPLVLRHGSSDDEDLRSAVATCILEHVLEDHFDRYFPEIEQEIRSGNHNLKDTLKLCWKMGKAEQSEHSARWESLLREET